METLPQTHFQGSQQVRHVIARLVAASPHIAAEHALACERAVMSEADWSLNTYKDYFMPFAGSLTPLNPTLDFVLLRGHNNSLFINTPSVANMPHSGLKHCHIVTIGSYKDWRGQKIKDWVENASGKVTSSPRDDTTHAVITAKAWKQKPAILQEVLARKQNGQAIHVVDFEWLEKSLQTRAKRGENSFCYERREREIAKAVEKERKQMQKIDKAIQPKTVAGMLTQEFLGHTDQYVDQKEKQRALEKARAEAVARKEREEEKRKAFESQRDELRLALVAEIFKNGAKKSRDVLLSGQSMVEA